MGGQQRIRSLKVIDYFTFTIMLMKDWLFRNDRTAIQDLEICDKMLKYIMTFLSLIKISYFRSWLDDHDIVNADCTRLPFCIAGIIPV